MKKMLKNKTSRAIEKYAGKTRCSTKNHRSRELLLLVCLVLLLLFAFSACGLKEKNSNSVDVTMNGFSGEIMYPDAGYSQGAYSKDLGWWKSFPSYNSIFVKDTTFIGCFEKGKWITGPDYFKKYEGDVEGLQAGVKGLPVIGYSSSRPLDVTTMGGFMCMFNDEPLTQEDMADPEYAYYMSYLQAENPLVAEKNGKEASGEADEATNYERPMLYMVDPSWSVYPSPTIEVTVDKPLNSNEKKKIALADQVLLRLAEEDRWEGAPPLNLQKLWLSDIDGDGKQDILAYASSVSGDTYEWDDLKNKHSVVFVFFHQKGKPVVQILSMCLPSGNVPQAGQGAQTEDSQYSYIVISDFSLLAIGDFNGSGAMEVLARESLNSAETSGESINLYAVHPKDKKFYSVYSYGRAAI